VKKNDPLVKPLRALKKLMDLSACPWMIIGGVAASLLGKPRFTADVDAVILINLDALPQFMKNAHKVGLEPRVKEAEEFARKHRVLLLKHLESGIGLDISLGILPFEITAIEKSQEYKIGDLSLNLPAVEDLIIFKAVAHRPQDMLDIQEIINAHAKLDVKYIKKALQNFAKVLEIPEIWMDTEKIISKK
jgi:hypothetical protein